MYLNRTVAPATALLTLAETKAHLRINNNKSDTYLTSLIETATARLDGHYGYLRRALITQTYALTFEDWPDYKIRLPCPPLIAVSSITYLDLADATQTLAPNQYRVIRQGNAGSYIERSFIGIWPATADRPDAITVTYTAGYGAAASDVPMPIRQAALLLLGEMWANRGDGIAESSSVAVNAGSNPGAVAIGPGEVAAQRLLGPYIWRDFTASC
jgi:uncharacterized phiE125 gp8 family phage protein